MPVTAPQPKTESAGWHTKTPAQIFEELGASERGLSSAEAAARLARYGRNKLPDERRKSLLVIFLEQFRSPLIYLLLAADAIVFFLREFTDAFIILFILLFNAILGAVQEGRAEHTLLALKRFVETEADALRDGKKITIPDAEVVPGDIILLQEGGKVPADARIIAAQNLKTEEAALTGESTPVRKTADALPDPNLATPEQKNMVFKGTNIAVGYGRAVVAATGAATVIGGISERIAEISTEIPLTKNLREFSRFVVALVALLVALLFAVGVSEGQDAAEMFIAAVAIAVAAIPEGLPLVLTIVLASGVWRMAKKRVLVKKLQAVEALGQAKVIAVDKTGTITKNELTVVEVAMEGATYPVAGVGYEPQPALPNPSGDLALAARVAALCSNAHVSYSPKDQAFRVIGDPTEGALEIFAQKAGFEKERLLAEYRLLQDWPFDYEKKYHAALAEKGGVPFLAVTGAPEVVATLAATVRENGREIAFDAKRRSAMEQRFLAFSERGVRVIAFAFLQNAPRIATNDALPPLTFGGLFAMQDGLRPGIAADVSRARDAGIQVIMVTGDHAVTARAIATQAGIYRPGDEVVTGAELDALAPEELNRRIAGVTVFSRVTPEHKVKIIDAHRARGEVIAMTGDGVNDAPSLAAADLGIAMGRIGTEVTKEAADLVLMDDNFGDIIAAVEEGRNLRQGIRRTITYLFSSNLGEILVIATALLLRDPLPLLAAQIIWMNLVTDTFFDVSLAMEPKDPSLMSARARIPKKLFDRTIATRLAFIAPVIALGVYWFFASNLANLDKARTIALTCLVFFQWVNAWNCRSETKSVFRINPFSNKFLLLTFGWVIVLQSLALYTPFLQNILGTVPLGVADILPIAGVAFAVLAVEELRKLIVRKLTKRHVL